MKSLRELCEGSWGYEPDQNDGTLDLRCELWWQLCQTVYDRCNKYITVKKNTPDADLAAWAWQALGALEYFIDAFSQCESFGLSTNKEYDRYYYWFRIIDKYHKNVFELYERCLRICEQCPKWIEDWKDPDAMRQSLLHRRAILETWKRLQDEYFAHEAIVKQQMQSISI